MDTKHGLNRIAALRGERGWSQEDLAQAAGVSTRTIQRLESGTPPAPDTAKAVAAAFDLLPVEVFANPIVDDDRDQALRAARIDRGTRWGIGSALFGYGCATVSILYNLYAGESTGREAGIVLGALGATTGAFCAFMGTLADRARRAS